MSSTAHSPFRSAALRAAFVLAFVSVAWLAPWVGAALAEGPRVMPLLSRISNGFWLNNDTLILMGERNGEYATYQITFGKSVEYKILFCSPYASVIGVIGKDMLLFRDKSAWFLTNNPPNFPPCYVYNARTGRISKAFQGNDADPMFYASNTETLYFEYPYTKDAAFKVKCELFKWGSPSSWSAMVSDGSNLYVITKDSISIDEGQQLVEQPRIVDEGKEISIKGGLSAKGKIYVYHQRENGNVVLYSYRTNVGYSKVLEENGVQFHYAEAMNKLFVCIDNYAPHYNSFGFSAHYRVYPGRESPFCEIFSVDDLGVRTPVVRFNESYALHSFSPHGDKILLVSTHPTQSRGIVRKDANIYFMK